MKAEINIFVHPLTVPRTATECDPLKAHYSHLCDLYVVDLHRRVVN